VPPRVAKVQLPPEGCAALIAQHIVGEHVTVVAAFHNVSADSMQSDDALDCDVLVTGNKAEAREVVVGWQRPPACAPGMPARWRMRPPPRH
jgi:predicted dinucleotide-binding enzyme